MCQSKREQLSYFDLKRDGSSGVYSVIGVIPSTEERCPLRRSLDRLHHHYTCERAQAAQLQIFQLIMRSLGLQFARLEDLCLRR